MRAALAVRCNLGSLRQDAEALCPLAGEWPIGGSISVARATASAPARNVCLWWHKERSDIDSRINGHLPCIIWDQWTTADFSGEARAEHTLAYDSSCCHTQGRLWTRYSYYLWCLCMHAGACCRCMLEETSRWNTEVDIIQCSVRQGPSLE